MKPRSVFAALTLAALTAVGGEPAATPATPTSIQESAWEITVTPYGWAAGVDADVSAHGYTAESSFGFTDIVQHLDMVGMLNIEARKGRWGGWVDGIYMKVSSAGDTPGSLLDSLDVGLEQVLAEVALYYRIWQGERGFMDLYAGARYMRMDVDLSFGISDSGVEKVSEQISDEVINQVTSAVSSEASSAKDKLASQIAAQLTERVAEATSRVADAKNRARSSIASAVSTKSMQAKSAIDQLQAFGDAHPKLVEAIRNSDRLQGAIRSVAQAKIDQKAAEAQQDVVAAQQRLAQVQQTATAAARARIAQAQSALAEAQAASARARTAAKKAVARAEKKLAAELEEALRDAIPSEISQSADWVDPFAGLRARYNFTDRFYAIAKADVGGFGIGSDLVWQVYAALGWHLAKNMSAEVGYRHMAIDYSSNRGFVYDVAMSGAQLGMSVRF